MPEYVVIGIGLLLAGLYAPFSYDEAFITYRYAENLSRGLGLVYNPGERFLGTTGPGWAILLGGLSRFLPFLSVPQWSAILSGLALLGVGIAVVRLMQRWSTGGWAVWAAVACMAHPLIIMPIGGEVVPVMALVLMAWVQILGLGSKAEKKLLSSARNAPVRILLDLAMIGYGVWHFQHWLEDVPDPRQSVQRQLAAWFRTATPPGCSIMGEEIGFMGYELLDYRVYDVWGLVTPGLAEAILHRDIVYGVQRYQPDYYIAYPAAGASVDSVRAIPLQPWFQRTYRPIFQLNNTGLFYAPYITIYEQVSP
ncbi:MAG: hypothetical protein RML46_08665 [Anaerolineae bacterium]|nr:hypothetical protein [Anaerolineae bacterium]MDW8068970.1 hypothetical protein [Anaerolineae bacterium]